MGYFRAIYFLLVLFPFIEIKAQSFSLFGDFSFAMGKGEASVTQGEKPTLGMFGLFANPRFKVFEFFSLGNTIEYRFINQYSSVTGNSLNYRGRYFTYLGPYLMFHYLGLNAKFGLKVQGAYTLANTTSNNEEVVFGDPGGFKFEVSYQLLPPLTMSLFYEKLEFESKSLNEGTETTISPTQDLSQYGLAFTYEVLLY